MIATLLKKITKKSTSKDADTVKKNNISQLPQTLLLIFVFILPLLYIPGVFATLLSTKMYFMYVVLAIVLGALLVHAFNAKKIILPKSLLTILFMVVPLTYIISGIFSKNKDISFFGRDFAQDSVFAIMGLFALMVVAAVLFGKKKQTLYLFATLLVTGSISAVVHLVNILVPTLLPSVTFLHLFTFPINTTLGKWNDLGLFAVLILMLATVALQYLHHTKGVRIFLYVTVIMNILLVMIVNIGLAWWLLGLFSLGVVAHALVLSKEKTKKKSLPVLGIVTLLLSALFLFFGQPLGNVISNTLSINHIEARPSLETTALIAQKSLSGSRVFIGSGPALFEVEWPLHRPVEGENSILATNFWNLDFRYGFAFVPSFIVTTGLIGIFAWLVMILFIFISAIRLLLKKKSDMHDSFIAIATSVSVLVLWVIALLYLPSTTLIVLTFIMTGVLLAQLVHFEVIKTIEISLLENKRTIFVNTGIVVLMIVVLLGAFKATTKFVAHVYFQKSISYLNAFGDMEAAEKALVRSVALDQIDTYYRSLAEIGTLKIQDLLARSENSEDITPEHFWNVASGVVANYQAAIAYDPNNYHNYLGLATFYTGLTAIGVEDTYQPAKDLFATALSLKPKNPAIHLAVARLELANNNDFFAARLAINQALELKPNYTDATLMLVQIEVSQNRTARAIDVLRQAGAKNQNDPTIYFQLGLLLFEEDEYTEAILAFERAIRLNPGLQNAKYFLGLSYYEVDETLSAVRQFQDLLRLNPQNEELQAIIQNLQQDKAPFANIDEPSIEEIDALPFEDEDEDEENVNDESGDTVIEEE